MMKNNPDKYKYRITKIKFIFPVKVYNLQCVSIKGEDVFLPAHNEAIHSNVSNEITKISVVLKINQSNDPLWITSCDITVYPPDGCISNFATEEFNTTQQLSSIIDDYNYIVEDGDSCPTEIVNIAYHAILEYLFRSNMYDVRIGVPTKADYEQICN